MFAFISLGWSSLNPSQWSEEHDIFSGPCQARIVHSPNDPDKAEVAWNVNDDFPYFTSDMSDYYLDVQFDDGVYFCIPKCLCEESNVDLVMEIGCAQCNGGFHFLLAF